MTLINRKVSYLTKGCDFNDAEDLETGKALMLFVDSNGDPAILIELSDGSIIQRWTGLVRFLDTGDQSSDSPANIKELLFAIEFMVSHLDDLNTDLRLSSIDMGTSTQLATSAYELWAQQSEKTAKSLSECIKKAYELLNGMEAIA